MKEYPKTKVNSLISVTSIVTVIHNNLKGKILKGEAHDFPEILFVEKGKHRTRIEGIPMDLSPGQIVIYAPGTFHGNRTPTPAVGGEVSIISFETEPPLPEEYLNRVITLTGKQRVALSTIIDEAIPLFEIHKGEQGMFLKANANLYTLQSVKNRLELFLLELMCPRENVLMSKINQITDYMMKNIGSAPQLQQIGSDLGMGISTLKRIVEETCGMPPMAYFHSLKIEEAKRMLLDPKWTITEISQMLGFSSVHYFSRQFKTKTGMTPSEYRNLKA